MFLVSLVLLLVLALAGYNVFVYFTSTGTRTERLAAAFHDSLTKFTLFWGGVLSVLTNGVDQVAQMTVDPSWHDLQAVVDQIIPALYHPWIALTTIVLSYFARNRTLPKTKASA